MSEKFPTRIPQESSEGNGMSRRDFLIKTTKVITAAALASQGLTGIETVVNAQKEQEKKLEELRQKSFYEDYAQKFSGLYGDRLYTNSELLNPSFSPTVPNKEYFTLTPKVRIHHYFLRNGRDKTFLAAEQLGCKHHQTTLDHSHPLEHIFQDAGIQLEGEKIDWLEVPDGRSGGMYREGHRYGGKTEIVMGIEAYTGELDDWFMSPAQKAGYTVDTQSAFDGTVANEITHEIQYKYFPSLFLENDHQRLDEPFKSFTTEVPGLTFKNNAQAAEFLSDVSEWVIGGKNGVYFRFFNPLYAMDPNSEYYQKVKITAENDRYWYSYQVQKHAMEHVLKQKGYHNPTGIIEDLIKEAENSDDENHDDVFVSARRYFTEDDFEKIAQIYRRIGVELLKKMKPHFSKPR
ncbi:MAG: hypothetical protein HYV32_01710 [Candidatus Kerfeldbacteria bacterium]|nr:hypothetical protein [Candidatus Kerfeldbacteria bacterium]